MKQYQQLPMIVGLAVLCGCHGFRYAATEAQKQNAWLHTQVCAAAADMAEHENASQDLCGLTALACEQSAAFAADYGLPENLAEAVSPEGAKESGTLADSAAAVRMISAQAKTDSLRKPDVFELADGVLEFGIALAGLIGGAYGIRIAAAIKTAREKSKALQEIIAGNELFKQLWPDQADRFKNAQQKQSPATQKLVAELKTG